MGGRLHYRTKNDGTFPRTEIGTCGLNLVRGQAPNGSS